MSECVVSVPPWSDRSAESESVEEIASAQVETLDSKTDIFASRQIQSLVQYLFFRDDSRKIRHVAFSALDSRTDLHRLCRNIGETLAKETSSNIVILRSAPQTLHEVNRISEQMKRDDLKPLQKIATRIAENLWILGALARDPHESSTSGLLSYLGEVRREFEYSIVEESLVDPSNPSMAVERLIDGVVFVISARHTKRAVARTVKERLERAKVNILGTIVVDRTFPIPDSIYRRL